MQREANRYYGFTAQQTLDLVQTLYEKKLLTYPRTDSQFITDDMEDTARQVISIVCRQLPLFSGVSITPDIARVTDNSKVTDHHAILPTVQLEKQDVSALPQSEQKILNLVGMRLLCATGEKHTYAETQLSLIHIYMNNKMITIPYADAIEYGENTSALFKALWELTDLIRLESNLKKHHRAYLHVREDIDEKVKEARQIMTKVSVDMIGFYFKVDVPESSNSDENTPFADAADDEAVSIPKDKYELMIDDLLTMSEIIQCVADMRTQDVKAIREFGKFVPAFAAFEKNRLSLYREAAKEAEEIFDRWADEIDDLDEDFTEDEDYEPDEYYSD